ncbi:SEL1-like repeat protein [Pseudoruegeria sp. HB172150]|uniref:SEL1-like repeat protein n=1 Tax=Pseudoruegeria sp. HB172150 TaxID=2721164 RepID=UPI001553E3EA|nr:SEL1-like repeat protein [Pseudoruegeria sp. HB172150]
MQLLFIGTAPEAGLEGALPADLPLISIPALPEAGAVQQEVFAARLRANPVSTFVSGPSDEAGQFDQFYLIARASLEQSGEGVRLSLGDDSLTSEDFAGRLGSAVQAFAPKNRRVGFLHLNDTADVFPAALPGLQTALTGLEFDMLVLMIETGESAGCDTAQPLHYSLISGLADRTPFGDGDGISTAAEVETYLTAALNRAKSRGCGPAYSLILKAQKDPAQILVDHAARTPFDAMENRLYHETFEAMFLLQSAEVADMRTFLDTCVYCPNESELQARLQATEDAARTAALEGEIWNRIRNDSSRERLSIYVENCALCEHREEALAMIDTIDAKSAARDEEEQQFLAAAEKRGLPELRAYVEGCIACTHREEAAALISEIEADTAYRAERDLLDDAVATRNPDKLEMYLISCTVCDGQAEVDATLEILAKLDTLRQPCLDAAGLPQFGGPRKLEEIDQPQALSICESAAREFPEDGLLRTTLGRIAQAAGDYSLASAAYDFGMEAEVPAAYGLAAYSEYAPPDGGRIDLQKVEALAAKGAEMGDWLSQEILTVIYSKDLVPGKSGKDAFAIAENIANQGNPLAQFFVGYYYLTGTGTEPSQTQAKEWLTKSVEQGYTHAFSFLAELYERGGDAGAPQPDQAADLYWEALEQGDPTAIDRLTTQLADRDREVVRLIQERLRDAGLYRGRVDGVPGPGTAAAIREYADALTSQG